MAGEFELIRRHAPPGALRPDVLLGSGDDAAILALPADKVLAATVDTLVAGRHFPHKTSAYDVGWKSLAVNLSDLAAMGAEACWATVALTLPEDLRDRDAWMEDFAAGLQALATASEVAIVGGDLTAGPLSVTIQALGMLAPGKALRRDGALPGDVIAVSGSLGDAALALQMLEKGKTPPTYLLERLNRPQPRLLQGQELAGLAHAAIDISDGLAADLGHILAASNVGARIHAHQVPLSEAFRSHALQPDGYQLALTGGDDYELCACLSPEVLKSLGRHWTSIGEVTEDPGLSVLDKEGQSIRLIKTGYDHFLCE